MITVERKIKRNEKGKVGWTWAPIIAVMVLFFVTTGCSVDDNVTPDLPVALVSFYQGSPNSPDLDIDVDFRQINFYPFEFADYTGYRRFYAGDRHFQFGPVAASSVVIDTSLTLLRDRAYSVFVADEYDDASLLLLSDDSAAPAVGKSKVRVINLSPDAPDVDLVVQDEGDILADGLKFKDATEFTEVDAQDYDFVLRNAMNDLELLSIPDIGLQSRYFYTIIIRGYENPPAGNDHVLSAQIVVN